LRPEVATPRSPASAGADEDNDVLEVTSLNCNSERIPCSLLQGQRANPKIISFLTVEDSLQLAAGSFNAPSLLINPIICNLFVFKIMSYLVENMAPKNSQDMSIKSSLRSRNFMIGSWYLESHKMHDTWKED